MGALVEKMKFGIWDKAKEENAALHRHAAALRAPEKQRLVRQPTYVVKQRPWRFDTTAQSGGLGILFDTHLVARTHQFLGRQILAEQRSEREHSHIIEARHVFTQFFGVLLSQSLRLRRSLGR